jgi:hypothetical protein
MLVSGRTFGAPLILLVLHDVKDSGMRADKGREILRLHHQSPHHIKRYHGGRTDAHLERSALSDQLAQAADD